MTTGTSRGATGLVVLYLLVATAVGPTVAAPAVGSLAWSATPSAWSATPSAWSATLSAPTAVAPPPALQSAPSPALPPAPSPALQSTSSTAAQSTPEADTTVTRVRLRSDAAAVWEVTVRTRLENETDAAAFEEFRRRFEADRSRYLDPFRDRMTGVVAAAAEATGREMAARNFSATTGVEQVPRRWGVVTFRFRWTGFAATDGDALDVGDVFVGGLFLGERDSLVVTAPAGYRVASADPQPTAADDASVRWDGRFDFANGRPRVRVVPASTGPQTTDAGGGTLPLSLPVGAVVLLGLAAVAVLAARRRSAVDEATVTTDEERVVALLSRNDGRMRQADIGSELDWSASKTSRVLSAMADAGTVEKVRLGRENVVELVEADGAA